MHNKLTMSVNTLIDMTTKSTDYNSIKELILENKDQVAEALQFIGDADKENCLEAAHLALWKVCPEDLESHVTGAGSLFIGLIQQGWEEYQQDVAKALDDWLEVADNDDEPEVDADTVQFLENCLQVNADSHY